MARIPIINAQLDKMNALLAMMVEGHVEEANNWHEIGEIVRKGLAPDVFSIGDQLVTTWKDTATSKEYAIPMDIVHFGEVELEDGEKVPGMFLQWHYCTPFGVQFDQNEALLYCKEAMSAGTYHFDVGQNWGSNVVANKVYQFTLMQEVPVGGQVQIGLQNSEVGACPDQNPANWRIRTYASQTTTTPIEIVPLSEGSDGVDLGTWSNQTTFGEDGLNNMQRSSYGYNRWSQSGIRQYLNAQRNAGAWWKPQNVYDRAPNEHATKNGFLTGFSDDFLSQIKPVKIVTALNTVSDKLIAAEEVTYDRFFLASKTNENLKEQYKEGDIWEYWYRATNGVVPPDYQNYAAPITYAVENHASPQYVRLRSAYRGSANNTWIVNSVGNVNISAATNAPRFAPACVIC